MSEPLKQKTTMQILMESFDKKYIEEIFREGEKMGLWKRDETQNLQYDYNGYRYVFSRADLEVITRQFMMRRYEEEKRKNIARKVG